MRVHRRGVRRLRAGGAAAELAIILPIIVALVFGQIESSRLGMVSQLLTTAAREGCRVAVINGKTLSDVQTRVTSVLSGSGISPGSVTLVDSDPGTNGAWLSPSTLSASLPSGGTAVTLTIRISYSTVSWLPTPSYLKSASVAASATLNSERP